MNSIKPEMRTAIILAGGDNTPEFTEQVLKQYPDAYLAAADAGLELCNACHIVPDLLVGDFDTVDKHILDKYVQKNGTEGTAEAKKMRVERHNPVKDASDLELTVDTLISMGFKHAVVLGALGGRADHGLCNIRLTYYCRLNKMELTLLDPGNRIRCFTESVHISRDSQWGKYVSVFPIGGKVTVTLSGFKYPLKDHVLSESDSPSLSVSNEIADNDAEVKFSAAEEVGIILMETADIRR